MKNNHDTINQRIKEILLNNGFLSICDNEDEELMFDSIEFVSLIVDIEKEFEINVPDEYLIQGELNNIKSLTKMVEHLCNIDSNKNKSVQTNQE